MKTLYLKEYSIDELHIYDTKRVTAVVISGWCVLNDGTIPYIDLYVNGQKTNCKAARIVRPGVNRRRNIGLYAKTGFQFVYKGDHQKIQLIEIKAQYRDEIKTIFQKKKADLARYFIHRSFMTRIDQYHIDSDTNTGTITGWALPLVDGDVMQYQVTDENNKTVESGVRVIQRNDLVRIGIASEEQKACGFIITISCDPKQKYYLHLKDGDKAIKFCVNDYILKKGHITPELVIGALKKVNKENIEKAVKVYKKEGIKAVIAKALYGVSAADQYSIWFRAHHVSNAELDRQRQKKFDYTPCISILVPTYNTPESYLREMIDTVRNQSYGNWQLCIADGSDPDHDARKIIQEYADEDKRIKVTYLDKNYGISGNTNKALELAEGEYTGLYDHDDFLELDALYEIVKALQEKQYDVIYTDEDKFNDKKKLFEDPNMKPDWSPDLFNSHNYITHFFVAKTALYKEVGGFRSEYDGAQDYDLMFRIIEKSESIYHLPKVLYHWRMHPGSTAEDPSSKMYAYEAGEKAIQEHLKRTGVKGRVWMLPRPFWGLYHVTYDTVDNPLVSIIIPNYDHVNILRTCVHSLFDINQYKNFEVIIVENNSKKKETFDYYKKIQKEHDNIHVVTWKGGEFNYSAINNFGVKYAKGDYLLFLNNDTECMHADSLAEMVGTCMRSDVGIVGARLLYEDNTIQHAGVVIGFSGYAGHVFNGLKNTDYGYMMRLQINCNYSAVTAACMLTKKEVFNKVNGFDEDFRVACNDVDYCLKVRQLGYLVVYNAEAYWHHFESKSRGYENNIDKIRRFDEEVHHFQTKWKDLLMKGDPYYNRNFKIEDGPFVLR